MTVRILVVEYARTLAPCSGMDTGSGATVVRRT